MDESLSEETRESAQKALDELVSAQIEQVSAHTEMKKREAERNTALEQIESQAQFKRKQADAKKMLQAAQDFEQTAQVLSDDMMEWLGQHRLQQCAVDVARIAGAYAASL